MKNGLREKISRMMSDTDKMQMIACNLLLIGLILFPIHLRYALTQDTLKLYGQLNYAFVMALCILMYLKLKDHKFERADGLMTILWLFSAVPVLCSNYSIKTGKTLVVLFNLLVPTVIVLYHFEKKQFKRFMRYFLIIFDSFIVVLLICAVIEKVSGNIILTFMSDALSSKEYASYLGYMETDVWRFYSVWGHSLTNAVLFNSFFILNDLYFRSIEKRYPKVCFFMVALLGVLFCSSKTAIAVLLAYMIISSWKNKKLMIGCGIVIVLVLAFGGFDILLERIRGTSLTTGRLEAISAYFQSGICPLHFFKGYGSGFVYKEQLYDMRAGFEFPVLMSALDYGILFSLLVFVGLYLYVTWYMLKRKCIMCWLGFSLLYAQFHTFNGLSLSNQDSFMWLCVFSMLLLNCAMLREDSSQKKPDCM